MFVFLTVVLAVLKLGGVIAWAWWIVLLPLVVPLGQLAFMVLVWTGMASVVGVQEVRFRRRLRQRRRRR